MDVSYRCPACGATKGLSAEGEGRRVQCSSCGRSFPVVDGRLTQADAAGPLPAMSEREEAEAGPRERETGKERLADRETVEHAPPEAETVTARRPAEGRVGRFLLRAEVGQGAFGRVYLAHDPRLDRPVALKVSKHTLEDPEYATRFLGEARAAARLRHPNIVAVFDSGQDGNDYFIASEFVEGLSLADWMAVHQAEPLQAVEWVRDLALALDYAHGQGIVHRDVKPANILVGRDGRPQLTDFGLARRADDPRITLDGAVLGTPAYMSPEQARGEISEVGPKSDQYSLGVVFYELLTGRLPFHGSRDMVMSLVAHEEPPPPRAVNRQVPPDAEAICLTAMAWDSARRYATAEDFADDLGRFMAGEEIRARRPGWAERGWRWMRRHRSLVGTLGAVVAAVVVTLAVVLSIPRGEDALERSEHRDEGASTTVVEPSADPDAYELRNRMQQSSQNLKQIGLALHHHHDVYKRFPLPAVFGRDGTPLLSWRVTLLPYLDQRALYERFRLDETWDSEHNKALLPLMPRVYAAPGGEDDAPTTTFYQMCVGPEAPFQLDPAHKLRQADVGKHDGVENTIMVVEAATAVPWTKPEDVVWEDGTGVPSVGGVFEGFHACMFDGAVRFFRPSIYADPEAVRSLLGWRDGQVVNLRPHEGYPKLEMPPPAPTPAQASRLELAEKLRRRAASTNQLSRIGRAMHAYDEVYRRLPRHAIYSADGRPLLSWRVALLPHLDQKALYERFHLDEPWDSRHNRTLIDLVPKVYAATDTGLTSDINSTYCQVVVGPQTPFPPSPEAAVRLAAVRKADGSAQTIVVAEAAAPVIWTKPEDIRLDTPEALPKFGGLFVEGFQACMADGSVRKFKKEIYDDADSLRALVGWRDGQLIDANRYEGDLIEQDWMTTPPAVRNAREATWRMRSVNNLKLLALAMHDYHDSHRTFPPTAIYSPEGKPLLSWRVVLLPYLEEDPLYDHFRLDEPWDSEHNRRLLRYMPRVYGVPDVPPEEPFSTHYQVFVGPGAPFQLDPQARLSIEDIGDGTTNTLMIVEAKEAAPWTKPQDVAYDPQQPVPPLGGMFPQGFHGATFAGAVRLFFRKIEGDQRVLRGLIGPDDGVEVDFKPYTGSLR